MSQTRIPGLNNLFQAGPRNPTLVLLATILILRSRLLSLPKETIEKLRTVTYKQKLSPDELSQALQQVYVNEPDGSKTLLVPYKESVSQVCP